MQTQEQIYWEIFLRTGQVADYLRYRRQREAAETAPRRRIEEASRHKRWE